MPTYQAPVDDALFLINDVFHIERYDNVPGFAEASPDLVAAVLAEIAEREIGALRRTAAVAPGPLSALAAAIMTFATRALRHRRLAYAVIAVFVMLSGYTFTVSLIVAKQATLVHIFFQAAVQLILLVPLITMRQFAEERRSGTLQLLLTAPVREIDIVAAKFVACMVVLAAMTGLTLVYAAVLAAYDDLIENNMRRIRILEEMARSIYREWFVKFRFPGHENVSRVDPYENNPKLSFADICHRRFFAEPGPRSNPDPVADNDSCPHV